MAADPADRTATLAPRDATPAPAPEVEPAQEPGLPIDDPERYEQVAEQGRGGLGRVVRAVDKRLGRTVAVKELLRQDDWHEARFVREALITARLEHPGIVPVHEAGRWPNGSPYYVMKLVEGRTLKELLARHGSWRERLSLLPHVLAIADAVGYAHSEGVIHRDLKPSNVIVGEFGETIVIDWGLARDRRTDVPDAPPEMAIATGSGVSTVSGKIVGTPAYMAPEQARGEATDERADVYALGAVLYELLAGTAPHADETPQTSLDKVIAGPPVPLAEVAPGAPTELVDIVAKAMARMPADRYPNATAVAEDLRRFSTGKLVSAHAYTPWQIVTKKIKQHRGVVVVALASAIVLGAMGVESFRKVVAERDIARGERARAELATRQVEDKRRELLLVQAQTSLRKDPTAALAWIASTQVGDDDRAAAVDVVDEAISAGVARHVFRPGGWVMTADFTADGRDAILSVRDGRVLACAVATGGCRELGRGAFDAERMAISPEGVIVTGGARGEVDAWSTTGQGPRVLLAGNDLMVRHLAFAANGRSVIVERGRAIEIVGLDGTHETVAPQGANQIVVAPGDLSRRIALVGSDQIAIVHGGKTDVIARAPHALLAIWISPEGDTIVTYDGSTVWALPYAAKSDTPLRKVAEFHGDLHPPVWSPDRTTIALFGDENEITLATLATGATRKLRGHTDRMYTVQFTRDGHKLVSASDDATARVWDLDSDTSQELRGHDDDVLTARLSPDEQFVITASIDGTARVWQIASGGERVLAEHAPIQSFVFADDYAIVQSASAVARWNVVTGQREALMTWTPGAERVSAAPTGDRVAVITAGSAIEVRDRDGAKRQLQAGTAGIREVAWSSDGKTLYASTHDGTLWRWDAVRGAGGELYRGGGLLVSYAVAADGRVAIAATDGAKVIAPDGHVLRELAGADACLRKVEFDTVRDRLIGNRCDQNLVIFDGDREIRLATGNTAAGIVVSPDGTRLAGAMGDRTVRVWDTGTGKELEVLRGHTDLPRGVAFSPDGTLLASSSYDHTIRIWQLGTKRHRVLRGHDASVDHVAWRSPGEIVTASEDGTLRVWPVPSLALPTQAELVARLGAATTARIDSGHRPTTPSR